MKTSYRPLGAGIALPFFSKTLAVIVSGYALFAMPGAMAQGINQATFTPAEIGTEIFHFPNEPVGLTEPTVGKQPTIIDFQHGQMHVTAGRDSQGGEIALTWWDLSNPRSPSMIVKKELPFGNKPHSITFWGDRFVTGHQGGTFRIWDYLTKTELKTHQGATGPVWWTVQAPYIYRPTNGYGTASNNLEVLDFSDINNIQQLSLVDLNQLVGFYIGATHPVGNLLVCTASQAQGVAVLDISDPANPELLDSVATTGNVYTSIVHGTRVYAGERESGIGVYNIEDPTNIVVEGLVPLTEGGDARYIAVKENIGWCAPKTNKLYKFDAVSRAVIEVYDLNGGSDFVYPLGNMIALGGSASQNRSAFIAVDENPDLQGPVVGMISPKNGATGQKITSRVGLVMSDQMDVTSLNATNFIVREIGGSAIAGTYSTQMGMINFSPDQPLSPNTTYEVVLPLDGVRDVVGNGTREEFLSVFSTGGTIDIDAGLTGHYPLDDGSGTIASDSTGGGNDGALTGFPASPWVSGQIGGGALEFDGTNDWVNLVNGDYLETAFNERSVALWVNADDVAGTQILYEEGGGTNGFVIRLNGATLEARAKNGSTIFDLSSAYPASNEWHHVAATYQRDGEFRLLVDGVVVDSVSVGNVRISAHTDNPGFGARSSADSFGGTGGGGFFDGILDDLRIYDRALTSDDIDRIRSLTDGFLGHWTFNQSGEDVSAAGHDGTLTNGASLSSDAQEGVQSLILDGADDFVDCGTFEVGQQFTASAWVKIPSATSLGLETILGNSPSSYVQDGFKLFIYGTSNSVTAGRVQLETGNGTSGNAARTDAGAFSFDEWHHVAVTVDRQNGLARIYIDGEDLTTDGTIRSDFGTNRLFHIGQMTNNSNELSGNIDDVRLYDRQLSPAEIRVQSIGKMNGHWRFDNNGDDLSGFDRDANLLSDATYTTDSFVGSHSLALDGASDAAEVDAFDLTNEVTVSSWVKIPSTTSSLETIFSNSDSGHNKPGFKVFVYGATHSNAGRIRVESGDGTSSGSTASPVGTFEFDQWNHVVVKLNRTAGTAQIFYNRLLVGNGNIFTGFTTNLPVNIGRMTNGAAALEGEIDEVRVYGTLASDDQIGALGDGSPNVSPSLLDLISSSHQQTVGSSVTFTASASDDNIGEELQYSFNFGDGSAATAFSSSNTANHSYSTPGRYVVSVTVTDGVDTDTETFTQVVHHPLTANPAVYSSTVVYDAVRKKVWVVNPDNDTVARIEADPADGNYLTKDFEQSTGDDPQGVAIWEGGGEVWVTCKGSGEISRFAVSNGNPLGDFTLGRGYQPVGIVFGPDQSRAFVACQSAGILARVNPTTRLIDDSTFFDASPRALAISGDSSRVFVTRFRSADDNGEVWSLDATNLPTDAPAPFAIAFDIAPNNGSDGRGVPNYIISAAITPDGRRLWVPSKKDNIAPNGGLLGAGQELTFESTTRSIFSVVDIDGSGEGEILSDRLDIDDTGMPSAVCFSPVGDVMFGGFIMNDKIIAFDTATGNQIGAHDVGFAPDGLCISDDGELLFVHNFLSRDVTTLRIDNLLAGTGVIIQETGSPTSTVASESLASNILNGKRVFYDASDDRMSGDNYISCASCHLNGDQDGRTWDFTARGEGLRNTTTLLGRGGMAHGVVHWTGNFDEIQDFELDIVNNFGGSGFINDGQNGNNPYPSNSSNGNAGRNADLDDLAAYVSSLTTVPESPFRDTNGNLTTEGAAGRIHFEAMACGFCHSGNRYTDSGSDAQNPFLHDVGTWISTSGNRLGATNVSFDTPTLRGAWSTGPFLHDGRYGSLEAMFDDLVGSGTQHDLSALNVTERDELIRFLYEIDDNEPAPSSNYIYVSDDRWTQSSGWKTVTHGGGFTDPIVIVSPLTANDSDESVVRVRNVTADSFQYSVQEWEYRDGIHTTDETIHFLVMNSGTVTIDGKQVTAGKRTGVTQASGTETFPNVFGSTPVVLAQIVTENDPIAVTTRIRNISGSSFEIRVQEEEGSIDGGVHSGETVHWISLEPGDYPTLNAKAGTTGNNVTHNVFSVDFGGAIGTLTPWVITGQQTTDGGDTCAIRWLESSLDNSGLDLFLEEETSGDTEVGHTTENVGWLVFGQN